MQPAQGRQLDKPWTSIAKHSVKQLADAHTSMCCVCAGFTNSKKVEQFTVCSPHKDASWQALDGIHALKAICTGTYEHLSVAAAQLDDWECVQGTSILRKWSSSQCAARTRTPAGRPLDLHFADLVTMHGSHDLDLTELAGQT